jgi:hypothetical protein
MDMTSWLDYFVTGLETQMIEAKERGEQVIRRDVLVQKHSLNDRQSKALVFLLEHNKLTIQDFEKLCPDVNRRSLILYSCGQIAQIRGFHQQGLTF